MALGDETMGSHDFGGKNFDFEIPLSADELVAELDSLNAALLSQDKMLRREVKERNEYNAKVDSVLNDLQFAREPIVLDEAKCDSYAVHMSNLDTMQTNYACLIDEIDEVKSRPSHLGVCKSYHAMKSELTEKNTRMSMLEKANCDSVPTKCALYQDLVLELEACHASKTRSEEENTCLQTILSWVSYGEP
jgi:hypothetical protein